MFWLLHEKKAKENSKWYEFIGNIIKLIKIALLPSRPTSPAYSYWDHSEKFEKEFENMNIIRKVVEYKFRNEKKVRILSSVIIDQHKEYYDVDFYHNDNVEWAAFNVDQKQILVGFE